MNAQKRDYRQIFSFDSSLPINLFFPRLRIFLGSPEAKTSISRAVRAALYMSLDDVPLDVFFFTMCPSMDKLTEKD
jgi:hypothetical protein